MFVFQAKNWWYVYCVYIIVYIYIYVWLYMSYVNNLFMDSQEAIDPFVLSEMRVSRHSLVPQCWLFPKVGPGRNDRSFLAVHCVDWTLGGPDWRPSWTLWWHFVWSKGPTKIYNKHSSDQTWPNQPSHPRIWPLKPYQEPVQLVPPKPIGCWEARRWGLVKISVVAAVLWNSFAVVNARVKKKNRF